MKWRATVLLLLLPLTACSEVTIFISPSGGSIPVHRLSPTAPPPLRTIGIGETAGGTLSWSHPADEFDVTVIGDGALVVRVHWDAAQTSTILLLKIGDTEFWNSSPLVARVPAVRGRRYRLRVAQQDPLGSLEDRYQITTAVEG